MKFRRRKNPNELLKHPVFISVSLSHMTREYNIPFLRTFSRGTDPFWLASHVRLHNMSRIYRMLLIVVVPCFPMLPLYLYSHLFPCFLLYPSVFYVLLCFLMRSLVFLCFPMRPPFFPMLSNVFPCFLMFSLAFLYFPMHPPVFLCFQMFSLVLLCFIPLFSYVHVSHITAQVVETSITINNNSPHVHLDDHTQPPTYVHHVTMLWLKNGIKYCCS